MYEDCSAARTSIFLEQYILNRDEAGNRFLKLFADKAAQGLDVRLVLDAVGSGNFADDPEILAISDNGGRVEIFNPKRGAIFGHLFPRDHCKTMLIDNQIAYTGSACMSIEMEDWRDTQVRITGPVVEDVRQTTLNIDLGRHTRWKSVFRRRQRFNDALYYIVNKPYMRNPIYKELLEAIRGAKTHISMVTPYLLLPQYLRRALKHAVRRGVRVTIMVSEVGDVPFADLVSRSYFPGLLRRRFKIMLYQATTLHAKYMIVDDNWATMGSTNLDYLSLLRNRESNLIIRDKAVVAVLQAHFEADMAQSREVTRAYLKSLPLWYRALGLLGRVFKRFL